MSTKGRRQSHRGRFPRKKWRFSDMPITLGSEMFQTRHALLWYFRTILRSHEVGYRLTKDEFETGCGLLRFYPPVSGLVDRGCVHAIEIRELDRSKCFFAILTNGRVDNFSYVNIADRVFRRSAVNKDGQQKRRKKNLIPKEMRIFNGCT